MQPNPSQYPSQYQEEYEVGIVGAGFGGLTAALALQRSGRRSFVVFERASTVGGTWRDNVYPGCACDVPSALYSFAGVPNPDWPHKFARQPDILKYLQKTAADHGLLPHIRFDTDITEARFEEATGRWHLTDRRGQRTVVRALLLAMGPLNRPSTPVFAGKEQFVGKQMHSANWDPSYDFAGKRVAVIGTGASAVQLVPVLASVASQLTVFQRTAAWVTPRHDHALPRWQRVLHRRLPATQWLLREATYWVNELVGLSFVGNKTLNKLVTWLARKHLTDQVRDPITRQQLTPDYVIGCKRILTSDDYLPTFNLPHVRLETQPIAGLDKAGLLTADGQHHPVDAVVYGTGFVAADIEFYTQITGKDGRNLVNEWRQTGAEAYLGTTVAGFPNLAFVLGPNTGLGHTSVVHMIDSQTHYLLQYLDLLGQTDGALDVRADTQRTYNEQLASEFRGTVWASGCKSWYHNANGRNTTLFPRLTVTFRQRTRQLNAADYRVVRQPVAMAASP